MTRMTRFGPILGTPYAKGSIEGFTGITLNRVIRVIRRCCPRAWRPGDVRSVVAARRYELLISDTTKLGEVRRDLLAQCGNLTAGALD
jgi:hypothetical protein